MPGNAAEYREAAAKHFGAMMSGRGGATAQGGDLMGSWEVVVGELDTFSEYLYFESCPCFLSLLFREDRRRRTRSSE